MDKIKEYLREPTSYATGLSLLSRCSRNQTLVATLTRRENKAKLIYELSKHVQDYCVPCESKAEDKPKTAAINPKSKVEYSTLPEEIKPCYDKAAVSYQSARKDHYAMKAATTDALRSKLRDGVLKHIATNHAAWGVVNQWQQTGEIPTAKDASPRSLASIATSLTRTLDKLDKATDKPMVSELTEKCTALAADLIAGGRVLSPKTTARMTAHKIEI